VNELINPLFRLAKWPVAIGSVALLPGTALAFKYEIDALREAFVDSQPFVMGVAGYMVVWLLLLRRTDGNTSFWSTLEHEATHVLFAILSFNRVRSLNASHGQGGFMQYQGRSNWLITISPYFFPTLSGVAILILLALDGDALLVGEGVLGITVAYHVTSTWQEIHRHQTDLQRVGFGFAWCFLPGANLVSFGLIMAMARAGPEGMGDFGQKIWWENEALWQELRSLVA